MRPSPFRPAVSTARTSAAAQRAAAQSRLHPLLQQAAKSLAAHAAERPAADAVSVSGSGSGGAGNGGQRPKPRWNVCGGDGAREGRGGREAGA